MNICIIPNINKDTWLENTKRLVSELCRYECQIFIDDKYRNYFGSDVRIHFDECVNTDVYIVLGGDGSIMRAAKEAAVYGIPILGINLGRVGYLAELEPDRLELLDEFFSGKYSLEERIMLDVELIRNGMRIGETKTALNDAVASHGIVSRLVDIELYCNGSIISKYRADGLIVSTPTGSTAYSMSAGGPVIDPALEALCAVPICPHSFYARPVIFTGDTVLEIRNLCSETGDLNLTVDGTETTELEKSDIIKITKSRKTTQLIRLDSLRNKGFLGVLYNKIKENGK